MEVVGIICEYNPFHNGHLYHINRVKELFPDSLLVFCKEKMLIKPFRYWPILNFT